MSGEGAFGERLRNAWVEIRENLGRGALQALGIVLGVASVLGGFSISDSQRKRADEMFVKMGGLDKLRVQPADAVKDGNPTALQTANRGLRGSDAEDGSKIDPASLQGVSLQRFARARVRSPHADEERQIQGIGGDFLAVDGYEIAEGRVFSNEDDVNASPVAVLGSEPAAVLFPSGDAVGQTIRVGDTPVRVIGVLRERIFRFRRDQHNIFRRKNRFIFVPASLVSGRMQGDQYRRLDRVTFRIPDIKAMEAFAKNLSPVLRANHRQQDDFRLDDIGARIRKERSQSDVYDVIFLLSGILALLGGGIVNVNIQMASLKDRVREVGVKMAIGAPGSEIFREFMTEAMLLTFFGSLAGFGIGVAFSKIITLSIGIPLAMDPSSFLWAFFLAGTFGLLFALYPAFKASRLSPMEALRYE